MSGLKLIKLEKLITKGKWQYVLLHGVVGWGISTAIVVTLIQQYLSDKPFMEQIWLALIIYPIAGIAFGLFMWNSINNQYTKLRSRSNIL